MPCSQALAFPALCLQLDAERAFFVFEAGYLFVPLTETLLGLGLKLLEGLLVELLDGELGLLFDGFDLGV